MGTKLLFSTTCHPQINGQTELTNRTLTTLLRGVVSKSLRDWDIKVSHANFTYNRSPSYVTHSPLKYAIASTLSLLSTLSPFLKTPR